MVLYTLAVRLMIITGSQKCQGILDGPGTLSSRLLRRCTQWLNNVTYLMFFGFVQAEKLVPSADGHNTSGQVDPSAHGHSGPLGVSVLNWPAPTDTMVIQATKELPEFPFVVDFNAGKPLGFGKFASI